MFKLLVGIVVWEHMTMFCDFVLCHSISLIQLVYVTMTITMHICNIIFFSLIIYANNTHYNKLI